MEKDAGKKDAPNFRECKRGDRCCGNCVNYSGKGKSMAMCRKHKFICGAKNTCDDFVSATPDN